MHFFFNQESSDRLSALFLFDMILSLFFIIISATFLKVSV